MPKNKPNYEEEELDDLFIPNEQEPNEYQVVDEDFDDDDDEDTDDLLDWDLDDF